MRKGFRPIVRIDRPAGDRPRQPAVFVLNRKSLTLDGIDLIVDVRDLSRTQTALFSCDGGESDIEELFDHDPESRAQAAVCSVPC